MLTDYTKLSNEELAGYIKHGDNNGFSVLIDRIRPHIESVATKYKNIFPDSEDLIQEGVVSVFSAAVSYDSTKSSFNTFANLCVDRAISAKVKSALAGKRIPGNKLLPFEDDLPMVESAEESVIKKDEQNRLGRKIENVLTSLEQKVLVLFSYGYSYSDISDKLNISQKSVDSALQRARSKFRNNP